MHELAKVGFHQSYTYFTWRNEQGGVERVRRASSSTRPHYMRPNFFVNTPDILHDVPRHGGRARSPSGRCSRRPCRRAGACTPATSCTSTCRCARAARSTSTRRSTSCGRATSPAPSRDGPLARAAAPRLNEIRRAHPALQQLRNLRFHHVDSDDILAFSKRDEATGDTVLVVVHDSTRTTGARRRPPRPAGARPRRGTTVSGCATCSPARSTTGASSTTSASTRTSQPAHVFEVIPAPATHVPETQPMTRTS